MCLPVNEQIENQIVGKWSGYSLNLFKGEWGKIELSFTFFDDNTATYIYNCASRPFQLLDPKFRWYIFNDYLLIYNSLNGSLPTMIPFRIIDREFSFFLEKPIILEREN